MLNKVKRLMPHLEVTTKGKASGADEKKWASTHQTHQTHLTVYYSMYARHTVFYCIHCTPYSLYCLTAYSLYVLAVRSTEHHYWARGSIPFRNREGRISELARRWHTGTLSHPLAEVVPAPSPGITRSDVRRPHVTRPPTWTKHRSFPSHWHNHTIAPSRLRAAAFACVY